MLVRCCRARHQTGTESGFIDFVRRQDSVCPGHGCALITDDGEAIEGAAAEEVEVMGRVTYFITSTYADDESPV